jgi:hypothetical protein
VLSGRLVILLAALGLAAVLPSAEPTKPAKPAGGAAELPKLDDKTYKAMVDLVRPAPEELHWKEVGWSNDLMTAVAEARALNRPILLWSDQGNPLGLAGFPPSINTIIARKDVYSDPQVQALCRNFVCTTAEVWTLATGNSPASQWFHAAGGPSAGGAAHGLYLFGPDGQNLGFQFISRPKEPVVALITSALAKWDALVKEKGYKPLPIPPVKPGPTWPELAAKSGLFLYVVGRDLPRDKPDERRMWNHQFLDLSASQARDFLPAGGVQKGMVGEATARMLARKYLCDFTKGNNSGYKSDAAVQSVAISTEVISSSGNLVTVRLHGEARTEEASDGYDAKSSPPQLMIYGDHRVDVPGVYGFDCTLHGKAVVDTQANRFAYFELVAVGTRRGGRDKNDYQPAPMGVLFMLEGQYDAPETTRKKKP